MHKGSSSVTPTVLEAVPITESDSIPQLSSSHTVSLLLNLVPWREKNYKIAKCLSGAGWSVQIAQQRSGFLNQVTSRGLKNGSDI